MIKVVDFFSGCGGTSYGLITAGLQVIGGLDNDRDASATYRRNIEHEFFIESDIRDISPSDIDIKIRRDGPLLFCGCAPCQPFSRQNRRSTISDPRRSLLQEFSRFISELLPEYVFVENVPGMQYMPDEEGPFNSFKTMLSELGYYFKSDVLPALSFGVPQTRERLILVASRMPGLELPKPTHGQGLELPSTVRKWIGDLPAIDAGQTHADDPDHRSAALTPLNLQRISATPEGGGRESWPKEFLLECHKNHQGHSDVYGRLSWDKPAAGLTTRCISYSNGRFGHPSQNRAISLREAARLQTFPITFNFSGSLESRARQIGNAVPPLMAKCIGEAFASHAQQMAG